ncbi:hypothetical protein ARC78_11130 [Stenotrophomonas pictorum JCM 9942]|uniref:MarR family transcriptional regulator n=2 Tax=Stenotrophomonas pictorum TaxID=86184 RepID=A0A0R0AK28_9GAMM|nr:DUF488 family protein [Stenotrophomonas pictorum]KRG41492.1 hypothetical protein ARC78_11130 [Stenotrophomonas pictorum JCM 9942]
MLIHCKRAYEPATADDGQRFLVDRLWPRGVSRERLQATWLKEVAPSDGLRQWFDHRAERWDAFRRRYWQELAAQPQRLAPLRDALDAGPVTLVFGARDEQHNQAVALRHYLLAHPRRST